MRFNNFAFLPISCDLTQELDLGELSQAVEKYSLPNYTGYWRELPVVSLLHDEDWKSNERRAFNWLNRYNPETCNQAQFNFGMDARFPQLKHFIEQLPFKKVTNAFFFKQTKEVPLHLDIDSRNLGEAPRESWQNYEPLLYKLVLSNRPQSTFYLSPARYAVVNKNSSIQEDNVIRVCPRYPSLQQCVAINESRYHHGAYFDPHLTKFTLSIFGILDTERHLDLLSKSYNHYRPYAIDLENPETWKDCRVTEGKKADLLAEFFGSEAY